MLPRLGTQRLRVRIQPSAIFFIFTFFKILVNASYFLITKDRVFFDKNWGFLISGLYFCQKLSVFRRKGNKSVILNSLTKMRKISIFQKSRKKFIDTLHGSTIDENNRIFFNLCVAALFALLISPGSENTNFPQKYTCWNISFSDLHIARMPKSAMSLKFP